MTALAAPATAAPPADPGATRAQRDWNVIRLIMGKDLRAVRRSKAIVFPMIIVPTVLPARDGRRVVTVDHDGTERHVVHFEMVPGVEPDEENLTVEDFHTLGAITATLHDHAKSWPRPPGFRRSTSFTSSQ